MINATITSQSIINWIKDTVHTSGFSKVVIGLSGGVDSALSATLATKALGVENVHIVLLPYGTLSSQGTTDAKLVIDWLKIPQQQVSIIDIKDAVDAIAKNAAIDDDLRLGNSMARIRMVYLFDQAKKHTALVCGTENKTEHYLGYFTRFGDEASDLEPLLTLYKTDVWEMAKVLGLPQQIITKAPTAGLWEGQTDEKELGFTYQEADTVLRYYVDEKLSEEAIVEKGLKKETVRKVLAQVKKMDFKHHLPHTYK